MRREHPRVRGNSSFLSAALRLAACCAFVFMANGIPPGVARNATRENALKAGYLFNFIKFVEWPQTAPTDALTVCFLGGSGVYDELAAVLPEKRLGDRRLMARQLVPGEPFTNCQVLYVDAEQLHTVAATLGAHAPAVLTVSEAGNFLHDGGIIELFAEGNRLRFRISLENARRANLRISSSLLQLASSVEKET